MITFGAAALVMAMLQAPQASVTERLPQHGTIVFLGDSITWDNGYVAHLELFLLRAYPDRVLRLVNRGIRGDAALDVIRRVDRDVVPLDPTWVVVMVGMNDGGYGSPSGRLLSAYLRNMERLVAALREKTRARLVLVTPTCVDPVDDGHRAYNDMLATMAEGLMDLGRRLGVETVDLFSTFRGVLLAAKSRRPPLPIMADARHPGPVGQVIIAQLLIAWLLPDERLDRAQQIRASACQQPEGATFTLSHAHRNSFVPPEALAALELVPAMRSITESLVVSDAECDLELIVDDIAVGQFSAEQLRHGIDLNLLPETPWVKEAQRSLELIRQRRRWSYVLWDPQDLGVAAFAEVGGHWTAGKAALRERAHQELRRIDGELRAGRGGLVTYVAQLRPVMGPRRGPAPR